MKFKLSLIFGILIVIVLISGCVSSRIVKHEKPTGKVDLSPFLNVCSNETTFYGSHYINCSDIRLEDNNTFSGIIGPTSEYFSWLTPEVSIARYSPEYDRSDYKQWEEIRKDCISIGGCMMRVCNRYIIHNDNRFKLINNKEEFINFFAPVESPEEALSFATALTKSHPLYGMSINQSYRIFVSEIEESYSIKTDEGFRVHLFYYDVCGCGPHTHYYVDYLVTENGSVEEIERQKIYEDPKLDNVCID
jgi:hypothetical protein